MNPNQVITIQFNLKDEEGNIIDASYDNEPLSFISGHGHILPKLEEEIETMLLNTQRTFVLTPDDAYGSHSQEKVQSVKRMNFPSDMELESGMFFTAKMPEGHDATFFIENIDDDDIIINFNHPLAGMTLTFEVELVDVRPATEQELSHGHVHGEHGHHH